MNEITHRLFLGIYPPSEIRDYFRDTRRKLKKHSRNFNFVPVSQIHMTIQFLGGNVSRESLEQIVETLDANANNYSSAPITIGKLKFGFPAQRNPSVLFWPVENNDALRKLTREIHEDIQELMLEDIKRQKDYAKIMLHFTLGRTKRGVSRSYANELRSQLNSMPQDEFGFKPDQFSLIESKFTGKFPEYTTLNSFKLN